MCRMAMFNQEGIRLVEMQKGGLLAFLDTLEESMGGHGNGYFIIPIKGKFKIRKGIQLDNVTIRDDVLTEIDNIKFFVYHTRLASMGNISSRNCHPFKAGNKILCMNGTERWTKPLCTGSDTDTETILKMCVEKKIDIAKAVPYFSSAFFGYENQKVFASKGNGSLELIVENDALVFASEFPYDYYDDFDVCEAPKFWTDGEVLKKTKNVSKNKYFDYTGYTSQYKKFPDNYFDTKLIAK